MAKMCDGCDKRLEADAAIRTVSIGPTTLGSFDLCPVCDERLAVVVNPTTWPRKVRKPRTPKPAPAATGGDAGDIPGFLDKRGKA